MASNNRNPVIWFEIPVTNIMRASAFYEKVFNYEISFREMKTMKLGTFPMVDGSGISGALIQVKGYVPHHSGTIVYFAVQEIESTIEKVQENGGKLLIPKTDIGEGFIAHIEDCEGNQIGIHSRV
jgi:predicted enzyme related to lactoylglutathione lyase